MPTGAIIGSTLRTLCSPYLTVIEDVPIAGIRTDGFGRPRQRQVQLGTEFAHPAYLPGRHPNHQCIGLHILIHDRARADKGVNADFETTDYGAIRTERGSLSDDGISILILALDQRPGIIDIRKNHARTTEYSLFEINVIVNGNIVLNLAVVADLGPVAHEYVLPQRYTPADLGAAADMHPMPDSRFLANLGPFIYNSRLVFEVFSCTHFTNLAASGFRVALV